MNGIFDDELRADIERAAVETREALRAMESSTREAIRDINTTVASIETQLTNTRMSFADDLTVSVSDLSSDVFSDSLLADAENQLTRSVNDDNSRQVFVFRDENTEMKSALNMSGKRFERSIGAKAIRNKVIDLKPVSES